jgi:arylsulfatase A-like enzyme
MSTGKLFASAVVAALAGAACSRAPEARPCVLLVTLDTTRADYLGCYGRSGDPTPCLDAIAREGTRFDLAIATAALTPVSHASILSGLDNSGHGVRVLAAGAGTRLPADVPTIATILRERGYRTAAVLSAFPVSSAYGFERGFDLFDCPEGALEAGPAGNPTWNLSRLQRRADATTNRAIEWLRGATQPFFLWVHYFDPHDAALSPPPEALPAGVPPPPPGTVDLSPELYAAEVRYMDAQIARLVAALRASGAWEHTLVAAVADHGEGLGDHGWQHHRILYQEEIRVPLLLRVPGVRHAASVGALVRTTDLLPTLLDYLGLAPPRPIDGKSLRGFIEGRAEPPRIALADAINGYDRNALQIRSRPLDDFLYCAMSARWKLVYRPAHPAASELFDLERDPGERENLFAVRADEALPLERELARRRPWVAAPFPALDTHQDVSAQRALAGLGYAGAGESSADPTWNWTCPEHADWRSPDPRNCPRCGSPPLLIAK